VLVPGRRLDRGDDLAGDAQLREVAEGGLAVRTEVADRLVQPTSPSWMRSSESPPIRKYDDAFRRTNE
jgi:hypothetical protein